MDEVKFSSRPSLPSLESERESQRPTEDVKKNEASRTRLNSGNGASEKQAAAFARLSKKGGQRPIIQAPSGISGVQTGGDSDPVQHVAYLSSPALAGRDSPSKGLDLAAAYIQELFKKYGVAPANPNDPQSPYYQTFNLWGFGVLGFTGNRCSGGKDFGKLPFQHGYFIDGSLNQEDFDLIEKNCVAKPPHFKPIQSEQELRKVSKVAGRVQNVVGIVEGTGPRKDEFIVVMGHYDHVGTSFGSIHPGADDNASGTSTILSAVSGLMEMQKRGELDRSVLFLLTAAEEKGLVGSQYFVKHPLVPMNKIAGVINADMLGRWQKDRISVIDKTKGKPNYFNKLVDEVQRESKTPLKVNRDIDAYYNRQDGAAFSRVGIDVLFLFEGLSNPNGGGDLHGDYHQPGDTLDKILKENGGEKMRDLRDVLLSLLKKASNFTRSVAAD